MDDQTLALVASHPAAFRDHIVIDTADGPKLFRDVVEPWQQADFEATDAAWLHAVGMGPPPAQRFAWLERPRGHSKTSDLALPVTWALAFSERTLTMASAAGDSDQAGLLRSAIERLVRLNPWLGVETNGAGISVQRSQVVNKVTGSCLLVLSSDVPTSWGLLLDAAVLDEMTHWRSYELWESLISSLAKKPSSCATVITNAGHQQTWQWDKREEIRNDSSWHFHALDGPVASWITPEALEQQRRLVISHQTFERLWLNKWALGSGDALTEAEINAAIDPRAKPLTRPEQGWIYLIGCDLGHTRDHSAVVVLGRHVGCTIPKPKPHRAQTDWDVAADIGFMERQTEEQNTDGGDDGFVIPPTYALKLVDVRVWKPEPGSTTPYDEIERTILELHRRFKPAVIASDLYQIGHMWQRLTQLGLPCVTIDTGATTQRTTAAEMISAFRDRTFKMFEHPQLIADLRNLRVVEKSYGIRLESPRGPNGHGDAASALGVALFLAKDFRAPIGPPTVRRKLITYP